MFEKTKKPNGDSHKVDKVKLSTSTASIGPAVKINGRINSDEDLVIEGFVDGNIMSEAHEITVAVSGTLKADVKAKIVIVDGNVTGDVIGSERVIVSKSGNVVGNIDAPRVVLEDGAKFKGSIQMDPPSASASSASSLKQSVSKDDSKEAKTK